MPSPGPVSAVSLPGPGRRSESASVAPQSVAGAGAAASPSGMPPSGLPPSGPAAARAAAAALQRGAQRRPSGEPRAQAPQPMAKSPSPSIQVSPARAPSAGLAVTRPVSTSVAVQSPASTRGAAVSSEGPPWHVDGERKRPAPDAAKSAVPPVPCPRGPCLRPCLRPGRAGPTATARGRETISSLKTLHRPIGSLNHAPPSHCGRSRARWRPGWPASRTRAAARPQALRGPADLQVGPRQAGPRQAWCWMSRGRWLPRAFRCAAWLQNWRARRNG